MGLNPSWQNDVFSTVQAIHEPATLLATAPNFLVATAEDFLLHLVPLQNDFSPKDLLNLQLCFQKQNKHLVHLWEDVWYTRKTQTINRISSFLKLNKGIHGRKVEVATLDAKLSSAFLDAHHLQGFVKAKYHYGLFLNDEVIASASFSERRVMKQKGEAYTSAELVRFASKEGLTVIGGLSKLIRHHLKSNDLNDLMTYADRDWSLGKGYQTLGFQLSEETKPMIMYVDLVSLTRFAPHRLPKALLSLFKAQKALNLDEFVLSNGYAKVFNTGNLKYHLYL